MPGEHALLSASGADRWIQCPPSARLEAEVKEERSHYANEGTFAHKLAELCLSHELGYVSEDAFNEKLLELRGNDFYDASMEEHIINYVDFCLERINEARARSRDAQILLEMRLDFSPWVPKGFGTGDLVLVAEGVLEVIDLKYGMGIPVSAEQNTQMRLYALGALNQFDILYDIQDIRMTIHQPRLDSISTDDVKVDDLLYWATNTVMGAAQKAWKGEGEFRAGEHCRFCKIRATCRERAEENLKIAQMEFREPPTLTDDEITDVLSRVDELQRWASDVQSYALSQAVSHGKKWPGWKLVEGRSVRKYADEAKIVEVLAEAGYPRESFTTQQPLGITKMEKFLGKKKFNELLTDYVDKPPGKIKLAPLEDKRQEVSSTAELDFKNNKKESV